MAAPLTLADIRARLSIGSITSPYKGAAIAINAALGFVEPKTATIPNGDLVLPDGRLLIYQGVLKIPIGGVPRPFHRWETADGLDISCELAPNNRTPGSLLHVGIQYEDRYPEWQYDVLAARYTFFPWDKDVMMLMPRDGDYVNEREFCFHLFETPHRWLDV